MQKFFTLYATPSAQSQMQKLLDDIETKETADAMYIDALILSADNDNDDVKYYDNNLLQLMTISADLGNIEAIKWLMAHDDYVGKCLAENLSKQTYELFLERSESNKNTYSLYMLGVINHVFNNPTNKSSASQQKLATQYYTLSSENGNPLAHKQLESIIKHKADKLANQK